MNRSIDFIVLALSLALVSGQSFAADPINSYNDGRIIQGGTYTNTVDGKTTFANSAGGGVWLKTGSNLHGIEVDAAGNPTNNGGTFHFYAPNSVVRLDGNVDVSALRNAGGASLGNGGKVFVDSAYLFQNGNIFANGQNGGLVQLNVGGMSLGQGAHIEATGDQGAGGVVAINTSGPVYLCRNSVIDTSGKVVGSFDTNLINIEGSLVNNEGTLRADGVNSRGGTIRLVATGQSDIQDLKDSLQSASTGSDPTITSQERTSLLQRNAGLISRQDGDVVLSKDTQPSGFVSNLSVNGTSGQIDANNDMTQHSGNRSGDGGTILIAAMDDVVNQGIVLANGAPGSSNAPTGGDGGTISLLAQGKILNDHGRLEANGGTGANDGHGGNGGLMAFGYNGTMTNSGNLYADGGVGGSGNTASHGGNGGLVVFSGDANPIGNGSIDGIARPGGNGNLNLGGQSGTIVSPNPSILGNDQIYFQQGYVNGQPVRTRATQQTQPVELLSHAENLILLTKNGGNMAVSENLFSRLIQARIRSVTDPTGNLGQAHTEVVSKNSISSYIYRNLVLYSNRNNLKLDMNHPTHREGSTGDTVLTLPSALSNDQAFTGLNTLTISNNGPVSTQVFLGSYGNSSSVPTDMWLIARYNQSLGGGRISLLANGDVNNTNLLGTTGIGSGGSINIATTHNFNNSLYLGGYLSTSGNIHGGSILVKAGQDITHNRVNRFDGGALTANGGLLGGTIRLASLRNFTSLHSERINSISANGGLQGGIIKINAGNNSIIEGNGALPPSAWLSRISANGISASQGQGGYIQVHAGYRETHGESVEARGGLQDGTILFTTGTN